MTVTASNETLVYDWGDLVWRDRNGEAVGTRGIWIHGNGCYVQDEKLHYVSDGALVDEAGDRPCPKCGRLPTLEGYDACMGHVEGAASVCCGHGVHPGHIIYEDDSIPMAIL